MADSHAQATAEAEAPPAPSSAAVQAPRGTRERIEPDLDFVRDLVRSGGSTVKRCFQCATCSVVCELAPAERAFPRKEMLWAQWGLRDRLLGDPDVFLCHECRDCSARCPRGARPGDVISVVRSKVIAHLAAPRFLGRMVNSAASLPVLLAAPFLVLALVLQETGTLAIPPGAIVFAKFAPHLAIEILFMTVSGLAALAFLVSGVRYWRMLKRGAAAGTGVSFMTGLVRAVPEILTHRRFRKCGAERSRSTAHLLVFFGFIALAVTAGAAAVAQKVFDHLPPLALDDPIKILGNVGAVMVAIGGAIMISRRMARGEGEGRGQYFDWLFLGVLYAVALTGILSELTRLAASTVAYPVYFVHLALVMFLLGYSPYSKFAHLLYRSLAMVFEAGRARAS